MMQEQQEPKKENRAGLFARVVKYLWEEKAKPYVPSKEYTEAAGNVSGVMSAMKPSK